MKRKTALIICFILISLFITSCGKTNDAFSVKQADIKADLSIQLAKTQPEKGSFPIVNDYTAVSDGYATNIKFDFAGDGSRLTATTFVDGTQQALVSIYFDENGNTVRIERSDGTYSEYNYEGNIIKTISYDKNGGLQKTVVSIYSADIQLEAEYEFNPAGAVSKYKTIEYNSEEKIKTSVLTEADGSVTTDKQLYDEVGRVVSATSDSAEAYAVYEFGYDENGELYKYFQQTESSMVQYGYACDVKNAEDAEGKLLSREYINNADGKTLKSFAFAYGVVDYRHYVTLVEQMISK